MWTKAFRVRLTQGLNQGHVCEARERRYAAKKNRGGSSSPPSKRRVLGQISNQLPDLSSGHGVV